MAKGFFINYKIKDHFRENSGVYFVISLFVLLGVVLGLYLSFSGYKYTSILKSSDKNMFDYIKGTASYASIFYSRIIDMFVCVLIVFCLNISVYTSFLSFVFIAYQSALLVLTSSALISLYGASGVINVIIFVLPVNILNIFLLMAIAVLSYKRAKVQHVYKINFIESAREIEFFKGLIICIALLFIICLVVSFILPLILKSVIFVNY